MKGHDVNFSPGDISGKRQVVVPVCRQGGASSLNVAEGVEVRDRANPGAVNDLTKAVA